MEAEMSTKQIASQLISNLPENASWNDVFIALQTRIDIEKGIADADAGRVFTTEEIMREFGI